MLLRGFPWLSVAFLCLPLPPLRAQAPKDQLVQVRRELSQVRKDLQEYQNLEKTLTENLGSLKTQSQEARERLSRLKKNLRQTRRKELDIERRLAALSGSSPSWRSALGAELAAYSEERMLDSAAISGRSLWEDAYLRSAIRQKTAWLESLEGFGRRARTQAQESRLKAQTLENRRVEAESEFEKRKREYEEKENARRSAREHELAALTREHELESTQRQLEALLKRLRKSRQEFPTPGPLNMARYSLPWPSQGPVVASYGRRFDPVLKTVLIHDGIGMRPAAGSQVRAVADGRVIFTGPFHSYGQVMILEHGSGIFSIYGKLGSFLKNHGQWVVAGEPIASAGEGRQGAGTLYFELRRGAVPLDPLKWLKLRAKRETK